jgi:hypothetical protein
MDDGARNGNACKTWPQHCIVVIIMMMLPVGHAAKHAQLPGAGYVQGRTQRLLDAAPIKKALLGTARIRILYCSPSTRDEPHGWAPPSPPVQFANGPSRLKRALTHCCLARKSSYVSNTLFLTCQK